MRRKLFNFTPEEREESKRKRIESKKKMTLAYQLGYYVGEQIVDDFLPTLSVDMLQTRKNISVTCAEGDECRRLDDAWFNKHAMGKSEDSGEDSAEWKALRAYHEMLENKYLKDKIECHFGHLYVYEKDMEDFKKGIGNSLWNCDCSHYSTRPENIEVKLDEDGWFTVITLTKSKE